MISKYRNKGWMQLACALALTGLLAYLIVRRERPHVSDNYFILLLFLYLGCWVLWMMASFSFAKAKGYGSDMAGGVFFFLILLGFCFPIAAFLFPAVVLFGLKDKTRDRFGRF